MKKMKILHAARDQLIDLPVTVSPVPPPKTNHSDTQLYKNLVSFRSKKVTEILKRKIINLCFILEQERRCP